MKIIITGISGFVGQNLSPYLANDFDVKGISRTIISNGLNYENFFQEKVAYDAIVHLAGKAHDLKQTSNDDEYYEVNFELTKRLYDHFLLSKAVKFIYISSVKAAADVLEDVLTENIIPNPITAYGKSKLMAENYILSNLPKNKKVYILRPCMIHGPGNKGNLNLLYQLVRKGIPYPLGAFENKRSFLSVENLCFVINQLLKQQPESGVYNIADDVAISTNELVQLIGEGSGKTSRILKFPMWLLLWFGKLGTFLHLPINEEKLQKLTESYVVDTTKIKKVLNIQLPISTKEGLLKTIKSFQEK